MHGKRERRRDDVIGITLAVCLAKAEDGGAALPQCRRPRIGHLSGRTRKRNRPKIICVYVHRCACEYTYVHLSVDIHSHIYTKHFYIYARVGRREGGITDSVGSYCYARVMRYITVTRQVYLMAHRALGRRALALLSSLIPQYRFICINSIHRSVCTCACECGGDGFASSSQSPSFHKFRIHPPTSSGCHIPLSLSLSRSRSRAFSPSRAVIF